MREREETRSSPCTWIETRIDRKMRRHKMEKCRRERRGTKMPNNKKDDHAKTRTDAYTHTFRYIYIYIHIYCTSLNLEGHAHSQGTHRGNMRGGGRETRAYAAAPTAM